MSTLKAASGVSRFLVKLFISGWIGIIALTVLVWCLPLMPFKATALLLLGVINGRYLGRWI